MIAHRVGAYLLAAASATRHVDSGAPWKNGYAESCHRRYRRYGKLREELLDQELFGSMAKAHVLAERRCRHYN